MSSPGGVLRPCCVLNAGHKSSLSQYPSHKITVTLAVPRLPHALHRSLLDPCPSCSPQGQPLQHRVLPHQPCRLNRINRQILRATSDEENSNTNSSGSKDTSSSGKGTPSSSQDQKHDSQRKAGGTGQGKGPQNSWAPLGWLGSAIFGSKIQGPLRVLFNTIVLYMIVRLWPTGGRAGFGQQDHVHVHAPFSEFLRRAKANEVQTVSVDGLHINFSLKPTSSLMLHRPEGSQASKVSFYTVRPADYTLPYEVFERNSVQFAAVEKKHGRLVTILVYGCYAALLLAAVNRLPVKAPPKGPGKRHQTAEGHTGITFSDVAGVDEAKEELQEIVEYLKEPDRFSKLGARPPSGVLLVGPPGTGKTLLAKAVAGEADVPFFSISASEFVELYVGMGAMRVRELFAAARKEAPSIVFIDEIDAVAKGRDTRLRGVGNDEREQTLNQLLTELDGFDSSGAKDKEGGSGTVICIAATNRADVLDAALLRPGRFDRRVSVERPDRIGREQILKVHLQRRNLPLASDVSTDSLAAGTTGFTGADLANLVNEAALLAGRSGKAEVAREDFDKAIMRAVAGIEKKRSILQGVEKDSVSKHEVGHALVSAAVARLIAMASVPEKLSIIPRSGGALGFTYIPPKTEDRALMFDCEIRGQLAMLMGGRAAEQLTCSAISTGAVDDIRRATDLAYKAASEFGLNKRIGPLNIGVLASGGSDEGVLLKDGGEMTRMVESEVRQQLEAALTVAMDVVVRNQALHEGLSAALTRDERVEGEALHKWLQHVQVPDSLRDFVLYSRLPDREALGLASIPPPPPPQLPLQAT